MNIQLPEYGISHHLGPYTINKILLFSLLQWNYDYHSATYLLLLQKKLRGRPIRLVASKTKKIARPLFEQPQPLTPYRVIVIHLASQIHCTKLL